MVNTFIDSIHRSNNFDSISIKSDDNFELKLFQRLFMDPVFNGPRRPWGLICGSGSLKLRRS